MLTWPRFRWIKFVSGLALWMSFAMSVLRSHLANWWCFLGPSGSGKTTLLRMIAGLETIDEGSLTIDGVRSERLPPGQRNVAMVFQNYALYPHMTVAENMAFGLEHRRSGG